VDGVRVDQNPVMRLLGHARLSVVVRGAAHGLGANVILPSASLETVRDVVSGCFASCAGPDASHRGDRRGGAVLLLVAGVVLTTGAWSITRALRPDAAGAVTLAVALAGVLTADRLWSSVTVAPDLSTLTFRRGLVWVRSYTLRFSAVHVLGVRQGPVGRALRTVGLGIVVHDGTGRTLRVLACPEGLAELVRRAVVSTHLPTCSAPGRGPQPATSTAAWTASAQSTCPAAMALAPSTPAWPRARDLTLRECCAATGSDGR